MAAKFQKIGPSQAPSDLPPNPSDEIFNGRKLPVIPAQAETKRRPFSLPVTPPLHFNDGVDGAAETVSTRIKSS